MKEECKDPLFLGSTFTTDTNNIQLSSSVNEVNLSGEKEALQSTILQYNVIFNKVNLVSKCYDSLQF